MAIFSTKDWAAGKTTKIRATVQKELNLAAPATDAEVSQYLEGLLRQRVRNKEMEDNFAAAVAANAAVVDI